MWPRVVEAMLALWLAVSPFVFRHDPADALLWAHDYAVATAVLVLALLSFGRRAYRAHLGTVAIALWLVAFGWARHAGEPPPASQNHVVLGLLLLMHAIIPSDCLRPPRAWREFLRERPLP